MRDQRRQIVGLILLLVVFVQPVLAQAPPNGRAIVDRVARETGTLIKTNTTAFTDQVCLALQATDPAWGRKVRRNGDWNSRNADAVAYRFPDGSKALVDVATSSDSPQAGPAWQVYPAPTTGNGYWMACQGSVTPPPVDPPTDTTALEARIATLENKVAAQATQLGAQAAAVTELTERLLAVAGRVAVLEQATPPPVIECIDVVVGTSREWGHGHRVTVPSCKVAVK